MNEVFISTGCDVSCVFCRGYHALWDWFGYQFQASFAQWPLALGIGTPSTCDLVQQNTASLLDIPLFHSEHVDVISDINILHLIA